VEDLTAAQKKVNKKKVDCGKERKRMEEEIKKFKASIRASRRL